MQQPENHNSWNETSALSRACSPPPIPREQAGLLLGYLAKAETNQRFPEMQISETIYIKDFHLRKYRFV